MALITKSDILNGANNYTEVEIKSLGGSVEIRPLSDGEYNHIESIKKDIGKINTAIELDKKGDLDLDKTTKKANKVKTMDLELDMKRIEDKKYEANVLAVVYGLMIEGDTFNKKQVEGFKAGSVNEIAEKIIELTLPHKDLNETVEDFRK